MKLFVSDAALQRERDQAQAAAYDRLRAEEDQRKALEVARAEGRVEVLEQINRAAEGQSQVSAPFDYFWNQRQRQSPRKKPQQLLSVDEMRRLSRTFDVVRTPIEHLKREARAVKWTIVPREKSADRTVPFAQRQNEANRLRKRVARARRLVFGKSRAALETRMLDDLLVTGAFAVSRWYDGAGVLVDQKAIDSGTIRIRVAEDGWTDPDYPYEQWLSGGEAGPALTEDDLYYSGINAETISPYFRSPIEWLFLPILLGLQSDEWNRAFFEGDSPNGLMLAFDATLTRDQILEWTGLIRDALQSPTERRGMIPVPSGTNVVNAATRRDADFGELNQWLLRRVMAIYGVAPSAAGFAGEQYKVSQEGSNEQTSRYGLAPILEQIKAFHDDTLERLGYGDLEVTEAGDDESVVELAPAVAQLTDVLTLNERRELLGYEPIENGDEPPGALLQGQPDPNDETTDGGDADES